MTVSSSKLRLLALAALLGSVAACDLLGPDGPEGPGHFDMELISPYDLEGSAHLHLEGGVGLGAVTCEGCQAFWEHHGGSSDIVILLDEPGRVRFRLATENVGKMPKVTALQVAGGDDRLRTEPAAYSVHVERVRAGKGGTP